MLTQDTTNGPNSFRLVMTRLHDNATLPSTLQTSIELHPKWYQHEILSLLVSHFIPNYTPNNTFNRITCSEEAFYEPEAVYFIFQSLPRRTNNDVEML